MSRMNAAIITSGQQPNFLNTLVQSDLAAARMNQIDYERDRQQQQNALYQQHGAGILAGDQNALNALAQLDAPQAAQIQQAQQRTDLTRKRFEFDKRRFDFQLEQFAAQATAEQKAEAAAAARKDAFMLGAAQSPEEFDQIAQEIGEPELVGGFEQRDLIVRKHMTAAELLEAGKGEKPADEYGRYAAEERAAGREPMSRIEFKRASQLKQQIEVTPDGGVKLTESFGNESKKPPKLTVDAAKNTGFLIRTQEANKVLNDLEGQGTRFGQQVLENVPLGLGNFGRDPEFQRFDQARRDFVNAILRRESGAVISDQEFDNANKQYFPVPGDSPEVIEQKRQNRINAIKGLEVGSGEGAAFVDQQEKAQAESEARLPDFKAMTDEELDAWIAENGQ